MALLIILIAFYFDYKQGGSTFLKDLKGGLFICSVFILSALLLNALGVPFLYIIFSIGIEIILIFTLKAILNNKN